MTRTYIGIDGLLMAICEHGKPSSIQPFANCVNLKIQDWSLVLLYDGIKHTILVKRIPQEVALSFTTTGAKAYVEDFMRPATPP